MHRVLLLLMLSFNPVTAESVQSDWRCHLTSKDFQLSGAGEWTSREVSAPFPFAELIYSWHPAGQGEAFRLFLKASFGRGDETEWLPAGYWGNVKDLISKRSAPTFDRGVLDMDFLKLKTPAVGFQFKVVSAGGTPLIVPPSLIVVVSSPPPSTPGKISSRSNSPAVSSLVMDVPLRRQFDSRNIRMKDRCQSAALASALQYFGKTVPLEQITDLTFDQEYGYPGIWPRVIAAAHEFGFQGYIERFRDWEHVRRTLAENKLILCSIRLREGQCKAPPYASMGNHIVVLGGMTDDGRVVVTDSALGKSGIGYLCQWWRSDFEEIWMRTKGGVGMVISPPAGAVPKLIDQLPPFPVNRQFPAGDDH